MTEPARVTGTVRRHFVEHDHPSGLYTVSAHRVTKSTEGEVMVPEGGVRKVSAGDVLVATDRPDVYTVYPGAVFDEMELEAQEDQKDLEQDTVDVPEEPKFNPNEHNAAEVRRYLRTLDTSTEDGQEEYDRVVTAEQEGNNRQSAFPRG